MREIVHHIDRHAERARPRRHREPGLARAGAQHGDDAAEIDRRRVLRVEGDARRNRRIKTGEIVVAVGDVPAHPRLRRQQRAQLGARQFAAAYQQHLTAPQVEKNRKPIHEKTLVS